MKITTSTTFFIKPGWIILKLTTDKGIVGYGECDLAGPPSAIEAVTRELTAFLAGQDPMRIEYLWQIMSRGVYQRGGPIYFSAVSAIEQALWDIKGKACHLPVFDMLGGACRTRVRMQARSGGDSPEEAASAAKGVRLKHYKAMKIGLDNPVRPIDSKAYIDRQVARLQAVRDEVGGEVDIAVDLNGRFSPAMAIRLINAMEPYAPLFFEEPCAPENAAATIRVSRATASPLAAGSRLHGCGAFRELLEHQALAVVQPDVSQVGGILEARKLAAMAETYNAAVAPLNPRGPVSLAASLQLCACIPNLLVLEHPALGTKWDLGHGLLATPFELHNGYITVPTGPGLGIELNEATLRDRAMPPDWTPAFLTHLDDGSVAAW